LKRFSLNPSLSRSPEGDQSETNARPTRDQRAANARTETRGPQKVEDKYRQRHGLPSNSHRRLATGDGNKRQYLEHPTRQKWFGIDTGRDKDTPQTRFRLHN
jgi:hypothetical protein